MSTLGSVEGTSHNCRRDWVPSMFTGPGIDTIGPPTAMEHTNKVTTRLSSTRSLAPTLDMGFSSCSPGTSWTSSPASEMEASALSNSAGSALIFLIVP
jgi:hypothetical protein